VANKKGKKKEEESVVKHKCADMYVGRPNNLVQNMQQKKQGKTATYQHLIQCLPQHAGS